MLMCVSPSIGGSAPVPLEHRLDVWLETVPALLQHLNVKHVALFSHSAGTTYTLNTLCRLPEILDPVSPFVSFIGTSQRYDLCALLTGN